MGLSDILKAKQIAKWDFYLFTQVQEIWSPALPLITVALKRNSEQEGLPKWGLGQGPKNPNCFVQLELTDRKASKDAFTMEPWANVGAKQMVTEYEVGWPYSKSSGRILFPSP